MTPETISALVNMGSAGAVIAVVVIFLKEMGKRDKQWQDFFTELNVSNRCEIQELAETMKEVVSGVHDITQMIVKHDEKVEQRFEKAVATVGKATASRKKADGGSKADPV